MAEPHAYSQPIQTYGPAPHNRNIWPHNSRAAAAPSRLADSFVCPGGPGLPTTDVWSLSMSTWTSIALDTVMYSPRCIVTRQCDIVLLRGVQLLNKDR